MKKFILLTCLSLSFLFSRSQFLPVMGPDFSQQMLGLFSGGVVWSYRDNNYYDFGTDSLSNTGWQISKRKSPIDYSLKSVMMASDSGYSYSVSWDSLPYQVKGNYLTSEIDGSITNEIQALSGSGRNVILSGGGGSYTIPITHYDSLTGKPNLSLYYLATNPNNYISSEIDGSTTNEIQSISRSSGTISITNGGNIHLPDSSSTNEIQVLSGSGRRISLSNGGGFYVIPLTSYDSLTNKPTIPTNTNQLTNGAGFLASEVDGSVTNEIELPSMSGQSGKVLSNNGSNSTWISAPVIKKQEAFSGTTNASGNYVVTFSTAYSVAPNIQQNMIGNTTNQYSRIVSVSTTGFTINAYSFNSLNIAGIVALLPTTANVVGASVDVLITEK